MSLPKLNPIEPPWYGPVCPVVVGGVAPRGVPYPDQSADSSPGTRFATDSPLREMDSNHRYPRERSLLLPRSELARRNRLAARTDCRLQRAKVSAYSNVSNGAEREPSILRISLLADAPSVGPGQQVAAAGLVRPIFPSARGGVGPRARPSIGRSAGPFGDPPEALSSCREYETEPEGRHQCPRLITDSAESSSMMVSIRQIHPA